MLENAEYSRESDIRSEVIVLPTEKDRMRAILKKYGVCLLTPLESVNEDKELNFLGTLMQQTNCPKSTRFTMDSKGGSSSSFTDSKTHLLHVDAAFRNVRPRYISLYCLKRVGEGGANTLLDVNDILSKFEYEKQYLDALMDPSGYYIKVKNKETMSAIVEKHDHFGYSISYTPIVTSIEGKTQLHEEAHAYFRMTIENLMNKLKYLYLFPNEYMIVDNYRMLHGRLKFFGHRKIQRMWFENVSK